MTDHTAQRATLPLHLPKYPKTSHIGRAKHAGKNLIKLVLWPLDGAVNIVLFAGLGGACQGLEEAGCPIHVANNHDPVALAAHAALNPHTRHVKGDIFDVDPLVATQGRAVKVLWGSPDCRDHSVAKGGAPRSARVRSLPWQLCRWIGKTRPEVLMVENVREIRGWGPLIAKRDKSTGRVLKLDGTVAAPGERVPVQQQQLVRDKRSLGRIFRQFVHHIQALGYRYEDRDLCCADFGVPTSRRRYFAVARRDGLPITWPERTHAPRDQAAALGLLPWVPASSIIDWTLPLPSIFGRKKPLAEATLRRIATGLMRYVIDNPTPFIVPVTHHGAARIYPVDETLRTVTSAHRGEMALVGPSVVPVCHTKCGPPRVHDGLDPLPTLTAGVKGGELAIAAAHLTRYHGARRVGEARGVDPADPLPTSTTENRFGLVSAHIVEHRGRSVGQAADQPLGAQTQGPHHGIVAAHLTKFRKNSAGGDIEDPLPTLTANGKTETGKDGCGIPLGIVGANLNVQTSPAAAWAVQHNRGATGHEAVEPLSTLTTAGTQQVAAAYLANLRGTGTALDAAEALPAQMAGGNHIATVVAFLEKYYGSGGQDQDCRDSLDTLTTKARFGVVTVTIEGQPYVITDIGLRMLQPAEQAAAHELRLPDLITIDGKTRPLTKTEQTRLIGNSVPKRMARLLAECNVRHALDVSRQAAE